MTKRIRIFAGHFGSGKSELAINEAITAREAGVRTALADLDIVKPYFRCRLLRETLVEKGVELIAPGGEQFYADLPIIVPEVRGAIQDPARFVCLDVGGDDTGARVLGSLADVIGRAGYDMFMVLNMRRPFTEDLAAILRMTGAIGTASGLAITGLISNTHLMDETTPAVVEEGYGRALEVSLRLGVPIAYVSVEKRLAGLMDGGRFPCPVRPIDRYILSPFARTPLGRFPLRGVI